MFFCFKRHANEAKGSIQCRIDPFASFVCQTADNSDNSYWQRQHSMANWLSALRARHSNQRKNPRDEAGAPRGLGGGILTERQGENGENDDYSAVDYNCSLH